MDQYTAVLLRKRAHYLPGRLLHVQMHPGAAAGRFEAKRKMRVKLRNRRVRSDLCRTDPISSGGVKHEPPISSEPCTVCMIPGRRFKITRLAATCPSGRRRWHAD